MVALLAGVHTTTQAQPGGSLDTLECHIIGFNVGPLVPSARLSHVSLAGGGTSQDATMASLYKSPYLGFGLDATYKYQSNWLVTLEGDIWFGSDNLQHRIERMGNVFSRDSIIIGTNGTDANATCYNRHLAFKAGVGKIIPLAPQKNPNSGLLLKAGAGYQRGQSIFMLNDVNAPQLDDDYALLYDHQRHGFMLTEAVGYWFMSNHANLVNCALTFEVSQLWSRSTRDYVIDYRAGLQGPDNSHYFDLLYTLRFTWMFPLKGKTVREYYFY